MLYTAIEPHQHSFETAERIQVSYCFSGLIRQRLVLKRPPFIHWSASNVYLHKLRALQTQTPAQQITFTPSVSLFTLTQAKCSHFSYRHAFVAAAPAQMLIEPGWRKSQLRIGLMCILSGRARAFVVFTFQRFNRGKNHHYVVREQSPMWSCVVVWHIAQHAYSVDVVRVLVISFRVVDCVALRQNHFENSTWNKQSGMNKRNN